MAGSNPVEDPLLSQARKKIVYSVDVQERGEVLRKEVVAQGEECSKFAEIVKEDEKTQVASPDPRQFARKYQLQVLGQALEKNIIVYLETGCGKTLIAVLLIKEMGIQIRTQKELGHKGIIVFLAPTVQLVSQQYEVIAINTDMKVAQYYGAKGVDGWAIATWNEEINNNEVLVMTPQILLDVLRHGFLKLEVVKLIIFDECHHARGNHPYSKIMKEYYKTSQFKPKIFGMTASPVIRKGVLSSKDCKEQIAQLEAILDSQVYTLEDRAELEQFVPTPKERTIYYSPSVFNNNSLKLKLDTLKEKYESLQERKGKTSQPQFKDYEDLMETTRKEIRIIHGNIAYCLENLGSFCAFKAVQVFMERCKIDNNLEHSVEDVEVIQRTRNVYLNEALQIFKEWLPDEMERFYSMQEDNLIGVTEGLITSKVFKLLLCLLTYRKLKDMRCFIFVERVVVAVAISSMINELQCFSNIVSDYLAGGSGLLEMSRTKQKTTFDLFSAGKVNVLVTTNVTEEGIDVQGCSCIIRFDLPKTVCSYIQSRGRARQPMSDYFVLIERGNEKQQDWMFDLIRSEESMRDTSLNRNNITFIPKSRIDDDEKATSYIVLETGATVNCDSSINFIYKYCAKLPGDMYYLPRPEFFFRSLNDKENLYTCILRLPPNAPFQEIISPPSEKRFHAKQLACLEACKKLHELGALNEYLLPIIEDEPEDEEITNSMKKSTMGAGTTKRKELHITSKAKALSGHWYEELNGVTLQLYKLIFTSQTNGKEEYSNFALLIEATLDTDVSNAEFDLQLTRGRVVRSRFLPCGELYLDANEVRDAKAFHEILFTGVFSKLFLRTKETNEPVVTNAILGTKITAGIWSSSNMYFLLPLECDKNGVCHNLVNIDWKCIHQCGDVARSLKTGQTELQVPENNDGSIYLASGPLSNSELLEKSVLTLHTGKIYCINNILYDINAQSPFPDVEKYDSYSDYFAKKYGKKLNCLEQPLLQAKQSHRPHNLLTQYVEKSKGEDVDSKVIGPNYIELPPELCMYLEVPSPVIKSLYLIPSVMHRMSNLMLASQLREEIQEYSNSPFIPATLIMQALTTTRCLETFSFERLELLGDSVLKFAVSCHLFLKYDKKHEGQLTAHRCLAIRNSTLHALATGRNLPGYIRDEPFDPSRWVAPGTHCKRIVPCRCDAKNFEESVKGIVDLEDKVVKIGKTCDKGHRWMCSKTISDTVEALIGSYLVGGGLTAAIKFMSWMNIPVTYEPEMLNSAFDRLSINANVLRSINIHSLESKLGYAFHNKALLVEAITHASQHDSEGGCSYQRLEFLGDSVLDFLITRHLFEAHPDLPPGILTDLRSAAVNNEYFAYVAIKHHLQQHLRHGSGMLLSQITGFVRTVQGCNDREGYSLSFRGIKAPKVLGDLVESIAGAILVDGRFNVEQVWEVMKPLFSPIVTPETLYLHPVREVSELCHLKGYPIVWKKSTEKGALCLAMIEVTLEDGTIVGKASSVSKKSAKEEAAQQILTQMKQRGIYHPRCWNLTCEEAPERQVGGITKQHVEETISSRAIAPTLNGELEVTEIEQLPRKKARVIDTPVKHLANQEPTGDEKALREELGKAKDQSSKEAVIHTKIVNTYKRKLDLSQTKEFPLKKEKIIDVPVNSKTYEEPCRYKNKDSETIDAVHFNEKDHSCEFLSRFSISEHNNQDENKTSSDETNIVAKEVSNKSVSETDHGCEFLPSFSISEHNNQVENKTSSDEIIIAAKEVSNKSVSETACVDLSMHKGGPRTNLYDLCKKMMWRRPEFRLEGGGQPHIARFVFRVVVDIPNRKQLSIQGEVRSDKKSAMDSAAVFMLFELNKHGLCTIRC